MHDLLTELIVDNFAGGGGASTGIARALGRPVDIAINHDRIALAMHEANHPETHHLCEDVFAVDPREATEGRAVGLAWFSPDCKHFSKAKGGKPVSKRVRGLAWVVIKWARTVRPRVIMLENVEEFQTWGPLTADNKPCPRRKGRTFRQWVGELRGCGYNVEWRELRACDFGAPTTRKRLFLIARCDGRPIVWPEPTHGPGRRPYRTAAECIDWTIPCPSIFERARPLAENTMRRIARGIRRYVIEAREPFIVRTGHYSNITGEGASFRGQSTRKPLGTVTAGANDKALVVPFVAPVSHAGDARTHSLEDPIPTITGSSRGNHALVTPIVAPLLTEHANASSPRSWRADEPLRTQCAGVKGGHFSLVAAFLAKHNGESVGQRLDRPAPTATVRSIQQQLVAAHLLKLRGTSTAAPADEPAPTISAGGTHLAAVIALLIKYYGNEREGCAIDAPAPTVTTKDRLALVTVHIDGEPYAIVDIGMRMLSPRELFRAQGFPESYIIDPFVGGKPINKTAQVRLVGNSVCPAMAEALVRANVDPHTFAEHRPRHHRLHPSLPLCVPRASA